MDPATVRQALAGLHGAQRQAKLDEMFGMPGGNRQRQRRGGVIRNRHSVPPGNPDSAVEAALSPTRRRPKLLSHILDVRRLTTASRRR